MIDRKIFSNICLFGLRFFYVFFMNILSSFFRHSHGFIFSPTDRFPVFFPPWLKFSWKLRSLRPNQSKLLKEIGDMLEGRLEGKFWFSWEVKLFQNPFCHILGTLLEHTYKPHYNYQNFSLLANGIDLNSHFKDPLALKLVLNGTKVSLMGFVMGL